jgi:SHS2 domain-containing protein
MNNYEILEHTADVRVRIYGKSIKDLFKNAAFALFSLIVEYKAKLKKEKEIKLEAQNHEELLVNWLNELISVFYAYKFLPASFKIIVKEEDGLVALDGKIKGEDFDPYENKKINMEIKAATYHNLKIEKNNEGYRAEIVFDV